MSEPNVFDAAAKGSLEIVKSLPEDFIHYKDSRNWTPLMFAARFGHVDVVQYLLSQGADASLVNDEGRTAAELAKHWGQDDVVKVLLGTGSDREAGQLEPSDADPSKRSRRRFPESRRNYFAGSQLNRLSFLRTDRAFLSDALVSPTSRFLLLANLNPLFQPSGYEIAWASYSDVQGVIGNPFVDGYPPDLGRPSSSESPCTGDGEVTLVFLGVDETGAADPRDHGIAYWTVDVTPQSEGGSSGRPALEFLHQTLLERGYKFVEMRPTAFNLQHTEGAILAQSRAMVDWNLRNKFCPGCGRRTVSTEAGNKRTCLVNENSMTMDDRPPCISAKGNVHNFQYPRTDPVIIVCVVSIDGERCLLGRQKSWPRGVYSCLAGFLEPGESLEEAVRREVLEESGVVVKNVLYHSSQPWPFPNSLMMGCLAEAVDESVNLEDKELEEARWFTRKQILDALQVSNRPFDSPPGGAGVRLPPKTAIAHQLVKSWATEDIFDGGEGLSARI